MKPIPTRKGLVTWLPIVSLIAIFQSCNQQKEDIKPWWSYIKANPELKHVPGDTTQQIILWRRPQKNHSFLDKWLHDLAANGEIQISLFCGTCDSSLMLLTGPGVRTYIQGGGGGKGGGTGCQINCPTGSGDTVYWCVNFPVLVPESFLFNPNQQKPDTFVNNKSPVPSGLSFENPDDTITVAVFDTGVDTTELLNYLYRGNHESCLTTSSVNADNGWNFADKTNIVQDNYDAPKGHGATVASLIVEQSLFFKKNPVRILPVKIHNDQGQSDLFSVLCGLAYAKDRGAQIINASFGYYALKRFGADGNLLTDSSALLMKEYIQYYLTETTGNNKPILLIAAAGNADLRNNDADEIALFTTAGLPPPQNLRNLDSVYFYPASFAADPELLNVIAVTTLDIPSGSISPIQNFSHSVVDLGVNADRVFANPRGDKYSFKNPREAGDFVDGSSFAAPIATGIIASNYSLIETNLSTAPFNKDNILGFLLGPSLSLGQATDFGGRIRKGIVFHGAH